MAEKPSGKTGAKMFVPTSAAKSGLVRSHVRIAKFGSIMRHEPLSVRVDFLGQQFGEEAALLDVRRKDDVEVARLAINIHSFHSHLGSNSGNVRMCEFIGYLRSVLSLVDDFFAPNVLPFGPEVGGEISPGAAGLAVGVGSQARLNGDQAVHASDGHGCA